MNNAQNFQNCYHVIVLNLYISLCEELDCVNLRVFATSSSFNGKKKRFLLFTSDVYLSGINMFLRNAGGHHQTLSPDVYFYQLKDQKVKSRIF